MLPYKQKNTICDRAKWFPGPWEQEPDLLEWTDTETGYACAIIRVGWSGHLCGYVQVPEGHLLAGKSYNSRVAIPKGWMERTINIDQDIGVMNLFCASVKTDFETEAELSLLLFCHGGLTYGPGDIVDGGSWLGFDCAHAGDLNPSEDLVKWPHHRSDVYRDLTYVKANCQRLAKQIWEYQHLAEFDSLSGVK